MYLNKEWNSVESSDDYSVVDISGQNVKRPCASLDDLLHTNSLLTAKDNQIRFFFSIKLHLANKPSVDSRGCFSYHKLLLCAPHAGASLCVLVCPDQ